MARKGSTKQMSVDHEQHIAHLYFGKRSPSSGAAEHDQGDIRTADDLIEAKMTGGPQRPARSIKVELVDVEKIADEAWSEGRQWALALRIYCPDSPVADKAGFVDMMVRPLDDDLLRENLLQRAREDTLRYAETDDSPPWLPSPDQLKFWRNGE